jgi:hypothetical protein
VINKKLLITIALIICVTVSTFAALQLNTRAQPPVPCTIRVVPSVDSVEVCTNFVVDVNIEDFYQFPVYDYEFILFFDPTKVEVVIAYNGDFLVEPPPVTFSYDDSTAGQVFCSGWTNAGMGATGWGTLATIEFHCLEAGYTPFDLSPTLCFISDEGGYIYAPDTLIGASVDQWETPPALVHLVPPTYTVPICIPFTVNVMVDDIADLHSFSLKLSYTNTAVVDCLDIEDGGFLPQPTTVTHKLIDDVLGIIEFDLVSDQAYGVDGSGSLAKITFHCTGAGESLLNIDDVWLYDSTGIAISRLIGLSSRVIQIGYWEPVKLQHIVEWPYPYYLVDIPFVPPSSPEGYTEVKTELEAKGYTFDSTEGTASEVTMFIDEEEVTGTVTSWWSSNTVEDGTRACMLSYENEDPADPGMAMGFVTNLLPPEQVPEVDPYIIVNAMQYFFVRFYWYAGPVDIIPGQSPIVSWSLWWYDSHHHPNWFWSPYYWWRTWVKAYYYPYVHSGEVVYPYWRPWWGWWWHWTYWKHWHWWSTYFPYDP